MSKRKPQLSEKHKFTSRYGENTLPIDPKNVCKGHCEGTGWVPIYKDETREPFKTLWVEAEAAYSSADGWHFVKCPECKGSGKAINKEIRG